MSFYPIVPAIQRGATVLDSVFDDEDAEQAGDLDGDAGFLAGLSFGALGHGLADLR